MLAVGSVVFLRGDSETPDTGIDDGGAAASLALFDEFSLPIESRSLSIGPAGDEMRFADGSRLVVPSGAVPSETQFTVERLDPGIQYHGFTVERSVLYKIDADLDARPGEPVELFLPMPADRTAVLEFIDGEWREIPSRGVADGTIVPLEHFSTRTIMALGASFVSGIRAVGERAAAAIPRWDLGDAVQQAEAAHAARIASASQSTQDFFGVGQTTTRTHADLCEEFKTLVKGKQGDLTFNLPSGYPGAFQLTKHLGDAGQPSAGESSAAWFWDRTAPGHDLLRSRILAAGASAPLTPAQVLEIALGVYDGNVPVAILGVHNLLKEVAYAGRALADPSENYAGKVFDIRAADGEVVAALETWRRDSDRSPSGRLDKMGPIYHVFAAMTARYWGGAAYGQAAISAEAVLRGIGWGPDIPDPEKGAADECGLEIGAWLADLEGEPQLAFGPVDQQAKVDDVVPLTLVLRDLPEAGASVALSVVEGKGALSHSSVNVSPDRSTAICDISAGDAVCGITVTVGEAAPLTVEARWGGLVARVTIPVALPEEEPFRSVKVASENGTTSLAPEVTYDSATVTVRIDPEKTAWIAWNNTPEVGLQNNAAPGRSLLGPGGFGTDDFIMVTVTNPAGDQLSLPLDRNDAMGISWGSQNVIFGAAADAPDALRVSPGFAEPPNSPTVFDEAGTHNAIFSTAGEYEFEFEFINAFTDTGGHPDVYLLIQLK